MRITRYPVILAYHRVAPTVHPGTPTVMPGTFDRQVAFLARRYRLMTLRHAAQEWLAHGRWPQRAMVITFDDGDAPTYEYAWPILRKHKAPATVFMIAGNVDQPNSLTRAQLRELAAGGIEIGSHTVHHAYLPELPSERVRAELDESRRVLRSIIDGPIDTMSYPAGGFTADVQRAVQAAGYLVACTTNRALNGSVAPNRWALRRIKMTERSNPPWVLAKLSGYYDSFRRLAAAH